MMFLPGDGGSGETRAEAQGPERVLSSIVPLGPILIY